MISFPKEDCVYIDEEKSNGFDFNEEQSNGIDFNEERSNGFHFNEETPKEP